MDESSVEVATKEQLQMLAQRSVSGLLPLAPWNPHIPAITSSGCRMLPHHAADVKRPRQRNSPALQTFGRAKFRPGRNKKQTSSP